MSRAVYLRGDMRLRAVLRDFDRNYSWDFDNDRNEIVLKRSFCEVARIGLNTGDMILKACGSAMAQRRASALHRARKEVLAQLGGVKFIGRTAQ